ncbi:MAG TPA: PA0069 family radical SAM protein [Candidatus Krumholzibacteria bacterium]|nr:PA0069 family radical SAM protein [Candidatus Krumholzibacteria bacterium]
MNDRRQQPRGRGSAENPTGRFERLNYDDDASFVQPDAEADEGTSRARTEFFRDHTRGIIARNDSPDVGFDASINPYRGCEHGCSYCFARPTHEYLGLSAGLDFETKIFVKENAPVLLRDALAAPSWKPTPLGMSGVTDPYQPIERRLQLTRRCLEVLVEFRQPVIVITKNHLVTRDVDLLAQLAHHRAAAAYISVTTLDARLARAMEPRTSSPERRLETMRALAAAGIPTGVLVAPVIPGLTDHELPAILEQSARAGARHAGYVVLRLPHGLKTLFEEWLDAHEPQKKEKVLARVRALRGGKLYQSAWGQRQTGSGVYAEPVAQMFRMACARHRLNQTRATVSTAAFRRPVRPGDQADLFA